MESSQGYSVNDLVAQSGFDRRTIVYYIQQGILPRVGRRGPRTRYPAECLTRLLFVRGIKDHQAAGRLPDVTLGDLAYALSVLKPDKVRELLDRRLPLAELESLFPSRPAAPQAFGRPMVTPGGGWRAPASAPAPSLPPPAASPPSTATAPTTARASAGQPATAPRPSLLERAPADRRSYGLADAGIRQRLGVTRPPAADSTPPATPPPDEPRQDQAPDDGHHEDTQPRLPALGGLAAGATSAPPVYDLGELLRQLELRAESRAETRGERPPGSAEQWTEIAVSGRVFLSVRGLGEADVPVADAVAHALQRLLRAR